MIFFLSASLIFSAALIMGLVSRWHGGGFDTHTGKVLRSLVWGVPFGLLGYGVAGLGQALVALAASAGGKSTGGGNAIDNGTQPEGKPEKLEFLVAWLKPILTAREYEAALNIVVGFAAVSGGVFVLLINSHFAAAGVLALGGALRAAAYPIAWGYFQQGIGKSANFSQATQIGEFLTGAFAGVALVISALMSLQ